MLSFWRKPESSLMIKRYSREQMSNIWSDESKYKLWLSIEILACEGWGKKIPKEAISNIKKRSQNVDFKSIPEIEKTVKHDVIAFLTAVSNAVGHDSRFIHMGMTSSDLLDTAFACQLNSASGIILDDIDKLLAVLKKRAFEFKDTQVIGRSHGIHAEPTTFGLKFALWYSEFLRAKERLIFARRQIAVGKISGAVGTFANIPPEVEKYVCDKLGLDVEPVSTQIVQRDRHAQFFATLALIASSVEKVALEIRHLQRTEVLEAEEPFTKGQKGSSAMPHKRNPILSENLCGLARLVRSNAISAMENVALWHERDISHSSVERIIAPDSTILVDFMLARLAEMLSGLVAYPERMKDNLNKTGGLIYSQRVLLSLVEAGMAREEAYEIVQSNALICWEKGGTFLELLKTDPDIKKHLKAEKLENLFDIKYHLKYVDEIFKRVF